MPDLTALSAVIAADGFGWLVFAAVLAGFVRGFSGFGAAMIYLPIASQVLDPFETLTTLIIIDIFGPMLIVPRAVRDGDLKQVGVLALGMVLFLPLGVLCLSLIRPEVFRYGVSGVSILLLVLLISGARYHGVMSRGKLFTAGSLGGFLGGSVGLPGPPVIFLYMASPIPASVIRANNMLYLLAADIMLIAVLWFGAKLVASAVIVGFVLLLPNALANLAGARVFRPGRERLYRSVAYGIILMSAVSGLPLFD